jgi:hypothetical protein
LISLYRGFPCDISMYICIITQIISSPPFFFFLPQSPSYCDFNRSKKNPYSVCTGKYIDHIHILNFLLNRGKEI